MEYDSDPKMSIFSLDINYGLNVQDIIVDRLYRKGSYILTPIPLWLAFFTSQDSSIAASKQAERAQIPRKTLHFPDGFGWLNRLGCCNFLGGGLLAQGAVQIFKGLFGVY